MPESPATPLSYDPPRLRPLGSVHELTQTKTLGSSDGLLFLGDSGGVVNGS